MKKTMIFLILVGLGLFLIRFETRAEGNSSFPLGKNYLDLSNLIMKAGDSGCAYTENPIFVKQYQQYTLVLDFGFLGQHSGWLGDISVSFEEYPSYDTYDLLILADFANERAYVEFVPNEEYIYITNLPMLPENYHAILYEGLYTDFSGFEPYINPNEDMDYHGVLPIDYDENMTLEQIKTYIHAYNPDGNPLSYITESDNYSTSSKLPGTYQMVFMTTFNQIAKRFYLEVRVFDQTAPVIIDPGIISIPLSEKSSLYEVKQLISVSDNVDIMSSDDLSVIADTYSAATTVGTYSITVEAVDSSMNTTSRVVTINLVDLNGPDISGPSDIYLYTTDTPLTVEQIKAYYTFLDDVSGTNVNVVFTVNEYQQTNTQGIYNMTIKASDQQLNFKLMYIKIHVIENRGPVFTTDEIILDVDTANAMTEQEIIDWFVNHTLSMGFDVSHVRVLYNEYENHEDTNGSYYVYLNYEVNGEVTLSRIRLNVEETESDLNLVPFFLIGMPSIGGLAALFIIKRKNR